MAEERTVRHEVHEETVEAPATTQEVTRETHTVQTEQVAPAAPSVTNVNATETSAAVDTATGTAVSTGGQVSINTPDGTQVNVNS